MRSWKNFGTAAISVAVLFSLFSLLPGGAATAQPPPVTALSPSTREGDCAQPMSTSALSSIIQSYPPPSNQTFLPVVTTPCQNFYDNFSNPESGWWVGNTSWMSASYGYEGGYWIIANVGYIGAVSAPTCKRQHYTVEVEVNPFTPGADRGLVFGINDDWSKYYIFGIDPNYRDYFLAYYNENSSQPWTIIKGYTRSLVIREYGNPNHLKVTRIGSQITLYVNGKLLGTWNHSGVLGETRVGLFTAPYETNYWMDGGTLFNEFRVTRLYPTNITAASEELDGVVTSAAGGIKEELPYHEQPYERLR